MDIAALLVIAYLLVAIWIVKKPFYGLLLVIVAQHFEYFLGFGEIFTFGRLLAIPVGIGWVLLHRRTSQQPSNISFLAKLLGYFACLGASTLFAGDVGASATNFLKMFLLIAMSIFLLDLVTTRRQLLQLVAVLALANGLTSVAGIIQYRQVQRGADAFGEIVGAADAPRFAGANTNPNAFGLTLALGLPFLLFLLVRARGLAARLLLLAVVASTLFSLFLTASRTHITGSAVFIVLFMLVSLLSGQLRSRQFFVAVAVIVVVIVGIRFVPAYSIARATRITIEDERRMSGQANRYDILLKSFSLVADSPFLGVGMANYARYEPLRGFDVHDTVSFSVGETGLLGTAILLAIVVSTLLNLKRCIQRFRRFHEKELLMLAGVMMAGFGAMIISSPGYVMPYQRMFWVYVSISATLAIWSEEMERQAQGGARYPGAEGRAVHTTADVSRVPLAPRPV